MDTLVCGHIRLTQSRGKIVQEGISGDSFTCTVQNVPNCAKNEYIILVKVQSVSFCFYFSILHFSHPAPIGGGGGLVASIFSLYCHKKTGNHLAIHNIINFVLSAVLPVRIENMFCYHTC